MRNRVWVVTPVFMDTESFVILRRDVIEQLLDHPEFSSWDLRFIVIDDSGGADSQAPEMSRFDTQVLSPPFNLGHQRAIVYGLRSIQSSLGHHDFVVTLDSDGEDRPSDVVRLLEVARESSNNLDTVVLALRTSRNASLRFQIMYSVFRILFRAMTGSTIRTGNFAVQRGWFITRAINHPSFDLCYSTSLLVLRRQRRLVPCARGERYAGESRMNTYRLVAHGIRMMLPFAEQMAVRLFTISASCLGVVSIGVFGGLLAVRFAAVSMVAIVTPIVLLAIIGTVTFVGFLTLFSGFAQSSAIAMQGLDLKHDLRSESEFRLSGRSQSAEGGRDGRDNKW